MPAWSSHSSGVMDEAEGVPGPVGGDRVAVQVEDAHRGASEERPAAGRGHRADDRLPAGDGDRAGVDVGAGRRQPRHRFREGRAVRHRRPGGRARAAHGEVAPRVEGDDLALGQVELAGDLGQVGPVVAAVDDRHDEASGRCCRRGVRSEAGGLVRHDPPDSVVVGAGAVELHEQGVVGGHHVVDSGEPDRVQGVGQGVDEPPGVFGVQAHGPGGQGGVTAVRDRDVAVHVRRPSRSAPC
ncbi:hypothetical protein SPURM210S_01661 [Streptomyces purpurascens]